MISLALGMKKLAQLTNKEMALPMNTGAEAVETAIKAVRRWGYDVKGIAENQAEIIACDREFPWTYDGSCFTFF